MRKRILTVVSSVILLSSSPVMAITQDVEGESVFDSDSIQEEILGNNGSLIERSFALFGIDIESYYASVQGYLSEQIAEYIDLEELEEDNVLFSVLNKTILEGIKDRLENIFGVLGYPNPEEINREIPEIVINDNTEVVEEFTPFGKKQSAIFTGKRKLTQAYIESRLGEEGQKQKKEQLEGIAKLAESSMDAASDAAESSVTQDVLKQVAVQQANNAFISQAIHSEIAQLGMNQTVSLSEMSNIAESLEQQQWKETVDSTAGKVSFVKAISEFSSLF